MCQENTQVEFDFGRVELFSAELCPLDLEKNSNNVSQEYTGQVQMWFYLNYFQQCNASLLVFPMLGCRHSLLRL